MVKLYILVGIAGSGKSTFIREHILPKDPDAVVVSTDAIRAQICGSEEDQSKNAEVFATAHANAREAMRSGKNVVFDATNINRKSRKSLLQQIGKINGLTVACHVLLCSVEQSMKNQERRERKVPEYAVRRQMSNFQMPEKFEGIDEIYYHNIWHEDGLLARLLPGLDDIDQTGKWHVEDAGMHTRMVVKTAEKHGASGAVLEAAKYHDVGKLYTRTEDENGAHFQGHEHVSAYLYLCDRVSNGELSQYDLYVARLIENHDAIYRTGFSREEFISKYGETLYEDLVLLRRCDEAGMILLEKFKDMALLDVVRMFPDWKDRLSKAPMNFRITSDGKYFLFKYNQLDSDMDYRCVRESRGCIMKADENGTMQYVCRPFDKFFNVGESHAAEIDWSSARVTEKVDGSLMKCWYDDGEWHLSTNGMINARDAMVADLDISFADIFERAAGVHLDLVCLQLDKTRTYMFELTSSETRLVIPYSDGVYYLACRSTESGEEIFDRPAFIQTARIKYPKLFSMTNLADVLAVVQGMSKDEEGVVVNDASGSRVKVKSPEYLMAAHLRMNGVITNKRIFEYIRDEKIDDFIAYVPKERERVEEMLRKIKAYCDDANEQWNKFKDLKCESRKEYAAIVMKNPMWPYIFCKTDHPGMDPYAFLMQTPIKKALQNIARY